MKVFERAGKINFVDENNVFLGYDMESCCCEHADWFIADTPQEKQQERPAEMPDLTAWRFDTAFFKQIDGGDFDAGGMAIFRITDGVHEKFVHIFNSQNGYYGHGFEFKIGEQMVRDGGL